MLKQGRLDKPYNGIVDCTRRTMAAEGVGAFWRGNLANVIRYFPTQALNFAFKDSIKAMFSVAKDASQVTKFSVNIASGGCPVHCLCCLSTLWTMHELEWPTMPKPRAASDSSTVLSMSTRRPLPLTVSPVSTVASSFHASASSSTEVCTLVSTTRSSQSCSARSQTRSFPSSLDGLSLPLLVSVATQSTLFDDE